MFILFLIINLLYDIYNNNKKLIFKRFLFLKSHIANYLLIDRKLKIINAILIPEKSDQKYTTRP